MVYKNPYFVFVILLCLIMSVALWAFFGYHFYLVWTGFTTNEKIKLGYAYYDFEMAIDRCEKALRLMIDDNPETKETDSEKYAKVKNRLMDLKEGKESLAKVNYSQGLIKNLRKVLNA